MAIEDHPARANFLHAEEIEQRIKSAAAAFADAGKSVKICRSNVTRLQKDWTDERQDHVKRLEHLNKFIKHYTLKIGEVVPSSVWPSLVIDDPKAPALDDGAAEDMKDAISSMGYDEVAELVRDQDQLQELRRKRETAVNIWQINSSRFPKMIAEQKQALREATAKLKKARQDLTNAQELRPKAVRDYLLSQGIGSLDSKRYPKVNPQTLPPTYMQYFNIPLTGEGSVSSAKQLYEKNKAEQEAEAKRRIEEAQEIEDLKARLDRAEEKAAVAERKREAADQRITQLLGAVEQEAITPKEIQANYKTINLRPHHMDSGYLAKSKVFLNKMQPVGKKIDVEFGGRGDHARREVALRAGVHITAKTFSVFVTDHDKSKFADSNMFFVEFVEGGYKARLALGEGKNQKISVATCFAEDLEWDVAFEKSLHPKVPFDACSNLDYTFEQLVAFHKLLKDKLLQKKLAG